VHPGGGFAETDIIDVKVSFLAWMGPENGRGESGFAIALRYLETVWTAISSVRMRTGRPPSSFATPTTRR